MSRGRHRHHRAPMPMRAPRPVDHLATGKQMLREGKLVAALKAFYEAIKQQPALFEPVYLAGMCAYQLRQYDIAAKFLLPAVGGLLERRAKGESVGVDGVGWATLFTNLAHLYRDVGDLELAYMALREAVDDNPEMIEALIQLGDLALERDDDEAAAVYYGRALRAPARGPDDTYSRSFLRLKVGQWEKGLAEYEARWQCTAFKAEHQQLRPPGQLWDGKPFDGTVILHREQGYGDCIQMLRYVPLVQAKVGHVVLEVLPAMHRLCEENFPGVTVVSEGDRPPYHAVASLLSLPYLLGGEIPPAPYLKVKRVSWDHVPPVGLCWAGGSKTKHDHRRSIPLDVFAPILERVGFAQCLQIERTEGLDKYSHLLPLEARDFHATAHLIASMGLVITVDTAVAHIAGALGVETWLLIPKLNDHRWGLDTDRSPWYPSMRIYRQQKAGDWAEVVQRICADLEAGQRKAVA